MLCFLHTCGFFFLSVKYVWLEGPSFAQNYIETSAPTSSCVIMPSCNRSVTWVCSPKP